LQILFVGKQTEIEKKKKKYILIEVKERLRRMEIIAF
jgi:hypothetical protein